MERLSLSMLYGRKMHKWRKEMSELSDKIIDLNLSKFMVKTRENFAQRDSSYIFQEKMFQEKEGYAKNLL